MILPLQLKLCQRGLIGEKASVFEFPNSAGRRNTLRYCAPPPCDWKDRHERKSILRGSGRGREIRRGFWLGTRHRDLLYQQPLDPLGDHPRHPGLALRDLRRAVWVVVAHSMRVARMSESDIRDHSNT